MHGTFIFAGHKLNPFHQNAYPSNSNRCLPLGEGLRELGLSKIGMS